VAKATGTLGTQTTLPMPRRRGDLEADNATKPVDESGAWRVGVVVDVLDLH
jgi:hypothetical protein